MSQDWADDVFGSTHAYNVDMQNIEENFQCLITNFSGSTAPTSPVAGQSWYDSTKYVMKHRNSTNNAWLASLHGSTLCELWMYRNDSDEGWIINSSVTDRVLALKGGTNAYSTDGGGVAGSWTPSGLSVATIISQIYQNNGETTKGKFFNSAGVLTTINVRTSGFYRDLPYALPTSVPAVDDDLYTAKSTHTHTYDGTDRPAAAIGTLQRPNI